MKKIILSVFVIVGAITLTFSCKKAELQNSQNTTSMNSQTFDFRTDKTFSEIFELNNSNSINNVATRLNIDQLMEIAKIEDVEARQTAYSLLTLPEKLDFWEYLIPLKVDAGNYTNEQKQILLDLKKMVIRPNMFASNNLQQIFSTQYLPLIAQQLKTKGFTGADVNDIFVTGSESNRPGPNPYHPKCVCNASSMFGCSSCKSTECSESPGGCGFIFWFRCDGECGNLMPLPIG